ncbi:phosphoenolpyruvate hydrolase family protein [Enterococcus alishanensis]|uniref:Phosphoenolpyruvate hydrolase family protein n=1 Tax=Enterococcus alishanensis TaxID=1303817 RepID=A0ABS6TA02_9ENTE|nr:phosphoenolpyruvate hydrolase family protein [Enterococcus alishanensis]MBV7389737.1 phosphoenolpyruvate hydrolase family protein [Enterococcus alishanensis]
MKKEVFLQKLKRQIYDGKYLLGISTATGMSAINAKEGGADMILALNSGKFRQMGRSSLGGYLPFANSNELVKNFSTRELLPILADFPVLFGVNATDPLMDSKELIKYIGESNFTGIVNYPTISLIDGQFKEALDEQGISFSQEVEFIAEAKKNGLFTMGFITNTEEVRLMDQAKPDIICIHLGLTEGGSLGAKKMRSFENMLSTIQEITALLKSRNSASIIMVYGGPINDLIEARYIYNQFPEIKGYIGGSTFERINSEQILSSQIKSFKDATHTQHDNLTIQILEGIEKYYDYVDFIKKYISENYSTPIYISELAEFTNLSPSYLSDLFKKKTGISFTEYLIKFRLNKSIELMNSTDLKLVEIADLVGYPDYAQFNKIFKKYMKKPPKEYKKSNI